MNKPRTIEGRWWIHGDDKPPHFGVLNFDPEKGLELTVKIPDAKTTDDVLSSFVDGRVELPSVIHGTDENSHPVTLFGCVNQGHNIKSGLETYRIGCLVGICNFHGTSWTEAKFRAVSVHYSLLHAWIGNKPLSIVNSGAGPSLMVNPQTLRLVEIAPGIRLRVEGYFNWLDSLDEIRYEFNHQVWLHFDEARPLTEIREDVSKLLPLLCLLTGERIFKDKLVLFEQDPFESGHPKPATACELLQINSGVGEAERGRHGAHMRVTFLEIEPDFDRISRRWFQCYETLKPVVDLYFSVTAGWAATSESRFLFMAQALEVYHARSQFSQIELPREAHKARLKAILQAAPKESCKWLNDKLGFSNLKTLAQRLDDILKAHPKEAAQLTTRIPDFAAKLRHTRNYYTHYTPDLLRKGKVAKKSELILLTSAVEALLQICLLKELGIHGAPIARVLQNFMDMKVKSLDSAPPCAPPVADMQESPSCNSSQSQ